MTRLFGTEADARLTEAWAKVLSQGSATQQIIHVMAQPTEFPAWLTGFLPFEAWIKNCCEANDEVWHTFADTAVQWQYIRNARHAVNVGISNVRIFVLTRKDWESAPPWLQYLAEVHLPAISALAGEALYRVWLEDCRNSGLPDRNYDVNLLGADGVMLAGYQNGDVDWRIFLSDDRDPDQYRTEHDFVIAMHNFASTRGQLVELPPKLRERSRT